MWPFKKTKEVIVPVFIPPPTVTEDEEVVVIPDVEVNYALTGPVSLADLDQTDKFFLYWMAHTDGIKYTEQRVNGMANAVRDIIKHIDMTQKDEYRTWLDDSGPDKYDGAL